MSIREAVVAACARIEAGDPAIWISRVARDVAAARAAEVARRDDDVPLAGVTFAVKDNIDVAGMPTTAGCPDFAYTPTESATVVARLEAAGAILLGKTNLDQFATGLVGTRSPFGIPRNPIDARFVPGGSSSGSAVAVARGMVSFALGTDTAGSGRVHGVSSLVTAIRNTESKYASGTTETCLMPCRSRYIQRPRLPWRHDSPPRFWIACWCRSDGNGNAVVMPPWRVCSICSPPRRLRPDATIFGSILRPGAFDEQSDVDLAIPSVAPRGYFELKSYLENGLCRAVDLVDRDGCHFAPAITRDGLQWRNPAEPGT